MDTDDLSEMAWSVIVQAAQVSDTLKVELGAMSSEYRNEDDWLRGVLDHLENIFNAPEEYVDFWDLENEEDLSAAMIKKCADKLRLRVNEILTTPFDERGGRDW